MQLAAILIGTALVMCGIGWGAYDALNRRLPKFMPIVFVFVGGFLLGLVWLAR